MKLLKIIQAAAKPIVSKESIVRQIQQNRRIFLKATLPKTTQSESTPPESTHGKAVFRKVSSNRFLILSLDVVYVAMRGVVL